MAFERGLSETQKKKIGAAPGLVGLGAIGSSPRITLTGLDGKKSLFGHSLTLRRSHGDTIVNESIQRLNG